MMHEDWASATNKQISELELKVKNLESVVDSLVEQVKYLTENVSDLTENVSESVKLTKIIYSVHNTLSSSVDDRDRIG